MRNVINYMRAVTNDCTWCGSVIVFLFLFVGVAWGGWGSGNIQYQDEFLVPVKSDTSNIANVAEDFKNTDTLFQSFVVRPRDPLAKEVLLHYICLSTYYWPGSGAEIKLNVYKGGVAGKGELLYSEALDLKSLSGDVGFTAAHSARYHMFTDSNGEIDSIFDDIQYINTNGGLPLTVDSTYTFAIVADSISERSYGFYRSRDDYPDGESNTSGSDIWFKLIGRIDSDMDSAIQYTQGVGNRFSFDIYSYQFPDKFVGLGATESIVITHPDAGSFSYEMEDPSIAGLSVSASAGSETLSLTGLKEGRTRVFVRNGSDTLSYFYVSVKKRRRIDVSYSYINYPGEHDHLLRNSFDEIAQGIKVIYDSVNVEIHVIDNGNIEYDWDFNNDSLSYDVERIEMWSPVDSGVIPNQESVFSNLFLIRESKSISDTKGSQSGNGSSLGLGAKDFPRAAHKAVHLNVLPASVPSTLCHELGHNLGLSHYTSMTTMYYPVPNTHHNLMKTGRVDNKIFGFQWETIHNTIQECADKGEIYDDETGLSVAGNVAAFSGSVALKQNSLFVTGVSQGATVQLFNLRGQLLYDVTLQKTNNEISLPPLSSQCVLSVVKESGFVQTVKRLYLQ